MGVLYAVLAIFWCIIFLLLFTETEAVNNKITVGCAYLIVILFFCRKVNILF